MGKTWPALDIHVPACDPQLRELVLAELDDFQPTAIDEPDEASSILRAFFTTPHTREGAARALAGAFGSHVYVEAIDVDDHDWAARSQAQLQPIAVGRIVVAPPWALDRGRVEWPAGAAPDNATRPLLVVIQPSMGFGTGHHATTRLMLAALQERPVSGRTVLDVGCGSGVLAIAALALGASQATAIDVDPDALENARDNARLNGVGDRLRLEIGDFRERPWRADLVLANLTGALLASSASALADTVADGGDLVVSGLMETERDAVLAALGTRLELDAIAQEQEWLCGAFHKSRHT